MVDSESCFRLIKHVCMICVICMGCPELDVSHGQPFIFCWLTRCRFGLSRAWHRLRETVYILMIYEIWFWVVPCSGVSIGNPYACFDPKADAWGFRRAEGRFYASDTSVLATVLGSAVIRGYSDCRVSMMLLELYGSIGPSLRLSNSIRSNSI